MDDHDGQNSAAEETHAGDAADSHQGTGGFGPEITFHHTFPAPGLYKVWGQFKTHDGQVVTADFVVRAR